MTVKAVEVTFVIIVTQPFGFLITVLTESSLNKISVSLKRRRSLAY